MSLNETTYDVFFSYSHEDTSEVEKLAKRVEEKTDYRVWLDKWVLPPGKYWQPAIAQALGTTKCCMIFIGKTTPSGWFNQEIQKALDRRANDDEFRIMAVLLPGANEKTIDSYLGLRTWIDFRKGLTNDKALHDLICGIRGVPFGKGPELKKERTSKQMESIKRELIKIKKLLDEELIDEEIAKEYRRKLLDNFLHIEVAAR